MVMQASISQLTTEPPSSAYWSHVGVDPSTKIHAMQGGEYVAYGPDGRPVEIADAYLAGQASTFARGGCPRCGGAWGSVHSAAQRCTAPGISGHEG